MKRNFRLRTKRNENAIPNIFLFFCLFLFALPIYRAQNTLECSELVQNNKCTCYIFETAIYLDCQDTTIKDIKNALKRVTNVHSFSIYDLDGSEEALGPHFIPQGACIKHVHISRTNIKDIDDETFMPLRKCLATLSIVSSKIKFIPQKALSGMLKLMTLELISNNIEEIPSYSFYGLPLTKLNIKGNIIRRISDTAFTTLELSLSEVDLSENNLTSFPLVSISNLKHLRNLKLAWNEIYTIDYLENTDLKALENLDLNSNNFVFILEDCLKFSPSLKVLSFHFNFIENVHHRAFFSLVNLKSIDLSYNRIKLLHTNIFQNNKNLEIIDLSHNHLHHIHGLLCNMPSLNKIFLSYNNILEVPIDSFLNSSKISVIQLDKNCIHKINSESLSDLENLEELQLDYNYLNEVPHNIFKNNRNLTKLRLDNNNFNNIHNTTLETLKNLKEVRINHNMLKFIFEQVFINSIELEEIYLNHNKIGFIEFGTFTRMLHLKYIALNNNNLVDINDILPKLNSKLLLLYLDYNHLNANNLLLDSQKKLQQLSLKYNRLKFITKSVLNNLSHLTRLELSHNEITFIDDFSFQRLNSARYLSFQKNKIKNITSYTFFGLSELEDLDLSHNKISFIFDMAFDTLKKLRIINLSFNPLRILHKNLFQQRLPLSSLLLDHCEIEYVENGTFYGLNNLKYLSLKNNSLKSNDLLCLDIPGLKYLSLSYNILDYLPVDAFTNLPLLETLYLEHCNVEKIIEGTFISNKNLEKLNLAQNILSNIPEKIFNAFNSISELNVSNNFLDYVPYSMFNNFTSIESIDIADNLIPKVELNGFVKLTKLKALVLRKNEIQMITSSHKVIFFELILFDISYNKLEQLPKQLFENFPNVQYVNISHNNIVHFDFLVSRKLLGVSLINIDLSKNPTVSWALPNITHNNTLITNFYELHICFTNLTNIEDITFEFFINLQHLYLKFNKIRRLSVSPFSKLLYLENLDLSFNRITHLKTSNFRGLTKLNTLCLSNNNIESMESFDEDLSNLKLLDLSYNKLQNIINEHLIHLKELTVLKLAYNNIKYLSATSFHNLKKIIEIDLEHNKLQTIPQELLISIETHVQDISIKDNIIVCRCQKNNTWTWIQDHPKIIKPYTVVCFNDDYPKEKCDFPLIVQLSVDKHINDSVLVTWLIRNRTTLKALKIVIYNANIDSNVKLKHVDKNAMSTVITDLEPNMHYIVCVLTMYDESTINFEGDFLPVNNTMSETNNTLKMDRNTVSALIAQSPASECASFDTITKVLHVKPTPSKGFKISTILNRRTGLIVGCCLGFIVFFIMVTVLLYTKVKERKRIAKSDPAWSEMNDYHSMQSKEDIQDSTTASTDNILLGMTKNRTISFDKVK